MITLEVHRRGIILPVKAQPKSRANELRGEQAGQLKVCVTAVPENGKANAAIIELLAKKLSLKKQQIELFSGATSACKKFLICEVTLEALQARLAQNIE